MKKEDNKDQPAPLNEAEKSVIIDKGTETAFSGEYLYNTRKGVYVCRQCGAALYSSDDKFESSCGWPSFDDEIPGAVIRQADADGERVEIICAKCSAHLGHVFTGEGYTLKNTRHCVNSVSMKFVPADPNQGTGPEIETAIFGGGCFWGVEYYMREAPGVTDVKSGYMGGHVRHPSYKEVCTGETGHSEVVKVVFDPRKTSYEELARLFFEIHDPGQENGQGPDIGEQYKSVIYYATPGQKSIAEKLMDELREKGHKVVTELRPADTFWLADISHQNYYNKRGGSPYCHIPVKRF